MLVVTPQRRQNGESVEDRKPRVISEIRKTQARRSPSLDGTPRLSGTLHHYTEPEDFWRPRFVAIRDGSLLVYASEKDPAIYSQSATLGRIGKQNYSSELLDSSAGNFHTFTYGKRSVYTTPEPNYFSLDADYDSWKDTPKSRYDIDGYQSLGRQPRSQTPGSPSLRIPLRNLNLRSCDKRPNAFALSKIGNDGTAPVAIFQAATRRDYERWTKTLAVEILRQTPLDAVRFFDVLGAFESEGNKNETPNQSQTCTVCSNGGYCNLPSCRDDLTKTQSAAAPTPRGRSRTKPHLTDVEVLHVEKKLSEDNKFPTRSKEKRKIIEFKYSPPPPRKYDRKPKAQRILFNDTKKLDSDSHINFDKKIQCNGKMTLLSIDTNHLISDNHALDEGIVVEDEYEDSSSEQSFGKPSRKSRRESDNSCLESPKSITSHSSLSEAKSSRETLALVSLKECDTVDACMIRKDNLRECVDNYSSDDSHLSNTKLVNCNKCNQAVSAKPTIINITSSNSNTHTKDLISLANSLSVNNNSLINSLSVNDYSKENRNSDAGDDSLENILHRHNRFAKNAEMNRSTYGRWSWEIANAKRKALSLDSGNRLYSRARSASPNKGCVGVQRRVASCTRFGRSSINEDPSESVMEEVNALKLRCQDTEHYVSVREKLALFETLSVMGHRLARSSEDLVIRKMSCVEMLSTTKRACSMHDLSEPKTGVPVKEMCKFFETICHKEKCESESKVKEPDRKPIACVVKWKTGESGDKLTKNITDSNTQTIKIVSEDVNQHLQDGCDIFDTYNCHSYRPIIKGNKIISYV